MSARPRVILDCEVLKDPHSGFSHFVVPLGRELARQNTRYQLAAYVPPAAVGALGPEFNYLTQRSFHKYANPYALAGGLWHATQQLSWYVPPRPLMRVVLTIHDLNFLHENPDEHTYVRQLAMVRRNIGRASYLVTISDFVRQDVLRHADLLGYDPTRQPLRYVPRGVEPPAPVPAGHRPAYVPPRPFLFGLGTLNAKKNWHVLPALLPGTDLELVLAGSFAEPAYERRIHDEAAAAGVADRVQVRRGISEADKAWYFQHCTAYVQPSLAEGFGLPVVEAMQLGKPVFLSRLTSLPEVGGAAACYFDSFDPAAMRATLAAGLAAYSPARAAAAQAQARQFSWAQAAAGYLDVYREVLGEVG